MGGGGRGEGERKGEEGAFPPPVSPPIIYVSVPNFMVFDTLTHRLQLFLKRSRDIDHTH